MQNHRAYVVYNKTENKYVAVYSTGTIALAPNLSQAMLFHDKSDAENFMLILCYELFGHNNFSLVELKAPHAL